MAQTVLITLTIAGADTGPFDLYSDVDGYITPFETSVPKSNLEAGYLSTLVPDAASIIRVQSDGILCDNYIDLNIVFTTTTTTTTTSTTTTTTTVPETFFYFGYLQVCGGADCADSGLELVIESPSALSAGLYSEGASATVYSIGASTTGPADYTFSNPISRTSTYCCV